MTEWLFAASSCYCRKSNVQCIQQKRPENASAILLGVFVAHFLFIYLLFAMHTHKIHNFAVKLSAMTEFYGFLVSFEFCFLRRTENPSLAHLQLRNTVNAWMTSEISANTAISMMQPTASTVLCTTRTFLHAFQLQRMIILDLYVLVQGRRPLGRDGQWYICSRMRYCDMAATDTDTLFHFDSEEIRISSIAVFVFQLFISTISGKTHCFTDNCNFAPRNFLFAWTRMDCELKICSSEVIHWIPWRPLIPIPRWIPIVFAEIHRFLYIVWSWIHTWLFALCSKVKIN